MKIIIYGKDNCPNCDKTKMLCRIRSIDFQYHAVGSDISIEDLHGKIGRPAASLPQIFLDQGDAVRYIGGYGQLRAALEHHPLPSPPLEGEGARAVASLEVEGARAVASLEVEGARADCLP